MMKLDRRKFLASGAAFAGYFVSKPALAQSSDLTELSIADSGQMIRSGEISPSDLVNAYLQRISRYDPQLNAYITVTGETALAAAEELGTELLNGRWRGPLHGIPIALKDNIDTANTRTTAASAVFENRVPAEDAEVVTRLKRAGAIILGKLNMHEFAFGATSAVTNFGAVRNPWDIDRIPGGSSGGSGSAVAARLCAGALGTDTGGSIRIPAAHCGIVGFKPTYGLSSIRGIIPLSVSLDHVGPMCRTVEDSALMLQTLAGYDPRGITSIKAVVPSYSSALQQPTAALRLGIPRTPFYDDVDSEILDSVTSAIEVLRELTASIRDVELPQLPAINPVFAEAFVYHADLIKDNSALYDPITLASIQQGSAVPITDYAQSLYELKVVRKAIADVFQQVDLLVTPTLSRLPVSVESALDPNSLATADLVRNPMPFNIYGIPSISIPCGLSRNGMPIGLQISGPALGEQNVLSLAHAYEQVTDWHRLSPTLM